MDQAQTHQEQYFDLRKIIQQVVNRWYYVMACIFLFMVIAHFINRYSHAVYQVATTIQVNKNQGNNTLDLLYGELVSPRVNLIDETILLKSFPLLASTLSELDFGVSYYFGNRVSLREMYKNSPIKVSILSNSDHIPYGEIWEIRPVDSLRYELETDKGSIQTLHFGDTSHIEGAHFVIQTPELGEKNRRRF